jgi:hypothetical protein
MLAESIDCFLTLRLQRCFAATLLRRAQLPPPLQAIKARSFHIGERDSEMPTAPGCRQFSKSKVSLNCARQCDVRSIQDGNPGQNP